MGKEVIFVQGGGPGAHEADAKLVASLQQGLGDEYSVIFPHMAQESDPSYDDWAQHVAKAIAEARGPIVMVGHSLGGYFLLKYLSSVVVEKPVVGICILAAPFPGGDENWRFDGFELPDNFGDKLPVRTKVLLYHSHEDKTVPFAHMALYAKNIRGAVMLEVGGGHQLADDLLAVAHDIRQL